MFYIADIDSCNIVCYNFNMKKLTTTNLGFDGIKDSIDKLGFSLLYGQATPMVHIPDLNTDSSFGNIEFDRKLMRTLESLEKNKRIKLKHHVGEEIDWGGDVPFGLTGENAPSGLIFNNDLSNNYSFKVRSSQNYSTLEEHIESHKKQLAGIREARRKFPELENQNNYDWWENYYTNMINAMEYEIKKGHHNSKDVPSTNHYILRNLLEGHFNMFTESMANGEPVVANNLLKTALGALNAEVQTQDPNNKIYTPVISIDLPDFSNLSLKNKIRLSETKGFESIQDRINEFANMVKPDEKGIKEAMRFQEEITPEIKDLAENTIKFDPALKKVVGTAGVYSPLLIGLAGMIHPDFRSLVIDNPALIGAGGSAVTAIAAVGASKIEQKLGRIEKHRTKTTNETLMLKPIETEHLKP